MNTLAGQVLNSLRAKGWRIATAESCTGGMIAAALTDIAGSSDVFERGFITYSNQSKIDLLGVPAAIIAQHGAVSAEVAKLMAEGALHNAKVEVALSVTGIAGPTGGSAEKPVGLVFIALASKGRATEVTHHIFAPADRTSIRQQAVNAALKMVLSR